VNKLPRYLHSSNDLSDFVPTILSSALAIKLDPYDIDGDDDNDNKDDVNEVKSIE